MGIQERLAAAVRKLAGQAGVVIARDPARPLFAWQEDRQAPAASLIKLYILWELYRRAESGAIDLAARVAVRPADIVPGFGIIKDLDAGLSLTFHDLATLMIVLSDNIATNILIETLGMQSVNAAATFLGAERSVLARRMMDAAAKERGQDNYTSPADIARFFHRCLQGPGLSPESRWAMQDILRRQQCNNKLPQGLPAETVFAHKTGDLPGVEHDAGILTTPSGPVILTVMTWDLASNAAGIEFQREVAAIVWDELGR